MGRLRGEGVSESPATGRRCLAKIIPKGLEAARAGAEPERSPVTTAPAALRAIACTDVIVRNDAAMDRKGDRAI